MDELALPSEIGLYFDFKVKDGIPYGCKGLERFTPEYGLGRMLFLIYYTSISNIKAITFLEGRLTESRIHYPVSWDKNHFKRNDPLCEFNNLQIPQGSTPTYKIFEEYAKSNSKFIRDFVPTLEKMLSNGYRRLVFLVFVFIKRNLNYFMFSDELTNGPNQYTGVVCPRVPYNKGQPHYFECKLEPP